MNETFVFRLSVNNHVWFVERINYIGPSLSVDGRYTLKAYPPPGIYNLRMKFCSFPSESNKVNDTLTRSAFVQR